ncbi:MAG: ABC transporter ATP-binding protein [Acidobacteriaceae bacterium]
MSMEVIENGAVVEQTATPMKDAVVAELQNVTKRYGTQTALNGLSLKLRRGEIVALLGENGAGKTTAVRLLLGLIAPNAGKVRVLGSDPRETRVRIHMGAMLQVGRVPGTIRVREHLDLFRSYYPHPLAYKEVVELAQLGGIEEKFFDDLSGGQKQRLLFALALCGDPELVFLDEPTVGLDVQARRGLWQNIRNQADRGKTVLLTTHYLEEADALADRIVVIHRGSLLAEGTPAEIKKQAAGRRIRCQTRLNPEIVRLIPGVVSVEEDRGALTIRASVKGAEAIVSELLRRDATLTGLEITGAGLDDAFLALTSNDNRSN